MKKVNCILLVDDDPTTNFLNEELISDLAIADHIQVAWNGQEALEYINKSVKIKSKNKLPRPNIIFLDINMPLMDGFVFLEHFAKTPKPLRQDISIIFLTTSDASQDRDKVSDMDIDIDFIEKPLRKSELLKMVSSYLRKK